MSKEEKFELSNLASRPLIYPKGWQPKDSRSARVKSYWNDELTDDEKYAIRLYNAWRAARCWDNYVAVKSVKTDELREKNSKVDLSGLNL